ncbi:CapA family protein [Aquibacillus sediminis]|uniref:CapA family protein n=1 Tax=Aquibacillus sediminis TaxID=2574734 RepID=UPI001FE9D7D6|nr:CapA family protein [Aquibacillus sediminis]
MLKIVRGQSMLFIVLSLLVLVACTGNEGTENNEDDSVEQINNQAQETEGKSDEQQLPEEPKEVTNEITVAAIGDLLIHGILYQDARTTEGYDFTPMFEQVKPFLQKPTITMANQETMIGGEELGLSTYPRFNSPHEVGDALKEVGVDVVTLANNHTLDGGEPAIESAIKHWETLDMMYAGAYKDEDDRDSIRVLHTDENIDVAFLSYTYGTNGIPIPEGKNYLVNLIDKDKIAADIETSKELADVIILSLHFGTEYQRLPNDEQKDLVQFAADQGVHAVIGHHPHVLQPVDWVEGKDGNRTFVAYSLGNFLSGQDEIYRQIGGMVNFTIEKVTKGEEESINIKDPKFLPTFVTNSNRRDFKVIPMYQLSENELANASKYYQDIKKHMAQWVPELEFIESE